MVKWLFRENTISYLRNFVQKEILYAMINGLELRYMLNIVFIMINNITLLQMASDQSIDVWSMFCNSIEWCLLEVKSTNNDVKINFSCSYLIAFYRLCKTISRNQDAKFYTIDWYDNYRFKGYNSCWIINLGDSATHI